MMWMIFIKTLKIYKPNKKRKVNPRVTELFIRRRKLNISLALSHNLFFTVPKNVRLNLTHYFVFKQKLQQIEFNDSSDIYF